MHSWQVLQSLQLPQLAQEQFCGWQSQNGGCRVAHGTACCRFHWCCASAERPTATTRVRTSVGLAVAIRRSRDGASPARQQRITCARVDESMRLQQCPGRLNQFLYVDLHLLPYKIPNCNYIKYQFADPDSRHHGQNSARSAQPVGRGRRHGADDARATARG